MATVELKQRGGDPIINLTQPGLVLLGDTKTDYHACFNSNQEIWGCGPDLDTATGDCLQNASSLSDITGFSLPESLRNLSSRELGQKAWSGEIPGIETRRIDIKR